MDAYNEYDDAVKYAMEIDSSLQKNTTLLQSTSPTTLMTLNKLLYPIISTTVIILLIIIILCTKKINLWLKLFVLVVFFIFICATVYAYRNLYWTEPIFNKNATEYKIVGNA